MKQFIKKHYLLLIAAVIFLVPLVIHLCNIISPTIFRFSAQYEYVYRIGIMCAIYAMLTISLNLITGFTGQLSMGHVAFYCIGAYASALFSTEVGIPVLISMVLGALVACFFGFLIGFPALRLSGVYLGIATLGFAEIVRLVANAWVQLTNGPIGLRGLPPAEILGFRIDTSFRSYIFAVALLVLIYFLIHRLTNSRTGVALLSIRDNEVAAESMGINIAFYKILTFMISAFIAGLCGAFYAQYNTYISPANFLSAESYLMLSMYALGGPASLAGSVGGATVLTLASELLRSLQEWRQVIYALVLILVVLFKPTGISGLLGTNKITAGLPKKESDLVLEKYRTEEVDVCSSK